MHEERRRSTKQDKLPDPQVSPVLYDRGHMATTYVENRHWMCCPASCSHVHLTAEKDVQYFSFSAGEIFLPHTTFLVFVFGVTQKWLAGIHCQPLLTSL
ncbi:unnamed protein product [Sphagnum balticum]